MTKAVLALNAGSSSIKFAVYRVGEDGDDLSLICKGIRDRRASDGHFLIRDAEGNTIADQKSTPARGAEPVVELLDKLEPIIAGTGLAAVGHRIVHGGPRFAEPVIIDRDVLAALEELTPLAPLHQPVCLAPIRSLLAARPKLPQVACFDTAFHRELEPVYKRFAIPDMGDAVHRYGFHGLSFEYVRRRIDEPGRRTVIAHLGSGCSICAVRHGKCVNTSMSMTPLDGLMMATRCGATDPGLLLYLQKSKGLSVKELEDLLYYKSGLLAVSGFSADMRTLLAADDVDAKLAIEQFCARAAEYVAVMATALGGLELLVFTGGIGENSAPIRRDICKRLQFLGVELDIGANDRGSATISASSGRVAVRVIPTNEEEVIAGYTAGIVMH
jgi:acetate kinase